MTGKQRLGLVWIITSAVWITMFLDEPVWVLIFAVFYLAGIVLFIYG